MGGGGAERVTANLANYWAELGWDITVVTLASCDLDFYELHPAVKRSALNLATDSSNVVVGLWHNMQRVTALRRFLRNTRPTIALGMMTTANVLLAWASLGLPISAVGSEHIHPPRYRLSLLWERLRQVSYGRLDTVTALTSESALWLKTHTTVRKVSVIPNAVAWPMPVQEPKISPESVCPHGRKVLLAVGRIERQKGFDYLLEAFAGVVEKHSDWDLVILGQGSLGPIFERQLHTMGLQNRVFLPGRVGNVGDWYGRADIYAMSSRFEGFGNTLAEALAHGVPSVSFDCETGPRDIIRHEVDGLLVPPDDVASLTAALDRLMSDAPLRRAFAKRAVEARERFSMTRIAKLWESLFLESLRS